MLLDGWNGLAGSDGRDTEGVNELDSRIGYRDLEPWEIAALEAEYAKIPRLDCAGKCVDSCTAIRLSPLERTRILHHGVFIPNDPRSNADIERETAESTTGRITACPALNIFGKCRVYEARPLICRAWPMDSPGMDCSHGCKRERPFTFEEYVIIREQIRQISESAEKYLPLYVIDS